jgi:phosphatidylglycerophosphate synthase
MGIMGIAGAISMAGGSPAWWLTGVALSAGSWVMDHVDGEVLRYYGQSSKYGVLLDRLAHVIGNPLAFLCLGWSLGMPLLGSVSAIAMLGVMAVGLEAKLAGVDAYTPWLPRRRIFRKLYGVYWGSIMYGHGPVIWACMVAAIAGNVLPYFFVLLAVSVCLNFVAALATALIRAKLGEPGQ